MLPEELLAVIDGCLECRKPVPLEVLREIRVQIAKTLPPDPWKRIDEAAKKLGTFMYLSAADRVSTCRWKRNIWFDTAEKCECWPVYYFPPHLQTRQQRKLAMAVLEACYQ